MDPEGNGSKASSYSKYFVFFGIFFLIITLLLLVPTKTIYENIGEQQPAEVNWIFGFETPYTVHLPIVTVPFFYNSSFSTSGKTSPVANVSPPRAARSPQITPQQTTTLSFQTTVPVSQYSRIHTITMTPRNVNRAIAGRWIPNPDGSYSIIVKGVVFGTNGDVLLSAYPGSESRGCPDFKAGEGAYSEMKFSDRIPVTPDKPGYGAYKYVLSVNRWNDGFYYMILSLNSGEQICMSFILPYSPPNSVITGAGSSDAIKIFSEWIAKGEL